MKFNIPIPLQQEHEALRGTLRSSAALPGEVGDAAKALARLMHPHFVKEHETALPPLGRLGAPARGAIVAFADELIQHARTEEEVMYPAAIVVGGQVRPLAQHAGAGGTP